MNWLDDESIRGFLDTAIHRTEITRVHRTGVGEAWIVLTTEDRLYLGTITRAGNNWNAFTILDPRGTRVSDFDTAVNLVVLTSEATTREKDLRAERQGER